MLAVQRGLLHKPVCHKQPKGKCYRMIWNHKLKSVNYFFIELYKKYAYFALGLVISYFAARCQEVRKEIRIN